LLRTGIVTPLLVEASASLHAPRECDHLMLAGSREPRKHWPEPDFARNL